MLLLVPALCDVEVAAALRRAVLGTRIAAVRAAEALGDYLDLPLTRYGHALLFGRVWQLRSNFSAYDAVYVALAERVHASLITADVALARAVSKHTAVEVLEP